MRPRAARVADELVAEFAVAANEMASARTPPPASGIPRSFCLAQTPTCCPTCRGVQRLAIGEAFSSPPIGTCRRRLRRCLHASGLLPPPQISAADQAYDEKNIRRRSVRCAQCPDGDGDHHQGEKSILWRGLPTNLEQEGARLQMDLASRGERMERKKQHLRDLVLQQVSFKELISRNRTPTYSASPAECRIALPFIVVNTRKETVIDCEMAADRQEIFFNFSAPFEIHDDSETLKRMNMHHREPDRVASLVPEGLAPFAMEVLAGSADMMGHGTINGNGKRK